ncbi:hypothetical protein Q671_12980 [Halomonas sp. PBN3]|nr:hypothetical protein Q671_12980 [Halomonas sp. PBN3]
MRRHLTQPLHPGVLHRHIRVQPLGDGMGDHRLALLLEQVDQALLLCYQGVDAGGFVVEKSCNGVLLLLGR